MTQTVDEFERGPYGEIHPPPLVAGLHPDEVLDEMVRDFEMTVSDLPGEELEALRNLGLVYAHQRRLRQAIAGELMYDPDARALYEAVVVRGEPVSLRPLGQEDLAFAGFAPVLQRVEGAPSINFAPASRGTGQALWRIGLEGHGQTTVIAAGASCVVRQAQQIYADWSDAERGRR
jgi:hypothetical protein